MAKSARASVRKANRSALRRKVFMPSDLRRQERLSAKLAELVARPKPHPPANAVPKEAGRGDVMEVDGDDQKARKKSRKVALGHDMEIDEDTTGRSMVLKKTTKKTPSRVQKKRRQKPHAQMVFPQIKNRKDRLQRKQRRN